MRRAIFGFVAAWGFTLSCFGATLTVDLNGGADYTDIQSAIDAAADGDTVVVEPGEYVITEPINFNRLHNPNPASPLVKNIVVKSEGGAEVTTIRMSATPVDPDRASVATFESGESDASVLEGFSITRAMGANALGWEMGGGVYCGWSSSPTLRNCTISGNSANWGGGVCCSVDSSPTLTNCTISGNSAVYGGGLHCGDSSPTLINCTISGNSAEYGGGVLGQGRSSPTLTNCRISGNSGRGLQSGGSLSESLSVTLTDCTIAGNTGGGVSCAYTSSLTMTNCTISGNPAEYCGGVLSDSSVVTLTRCTISGNAGGGVLCGNSWLTLTSCIVWDNIGGPALWEDFSEVNVSFSCIETAALWPGEGNIKEDPLFCGWGEKREVWVDPSRPGPGDGSQLDPFSDARSATTFSLALAAASPCLGTGEGGADMGADTGRCDGPGEKARIVHLAAGTYLSSEFDFAHRVRAVGSGEGSTVIRGTVRSLRTDSSLSDLTVTEGREGGVVILEGERPEIRRCTISGNSGWDGGGVYCVNNSSPTLTNCTITRNYANRGGGVYCYGASPTLSGCIISGNSAEDGGGVFTQDTSSPTLADCTISGNSATLGEGGGAYFRDASSPTLTGCIVWGNVGGTVFAAPESQPTVRYSCIQQDTVWPGEGNINADPLFCAWGALPGVTAGTQEDLVAAVTSYDLSLSAASPCIGTGKDGGTMGADAGVCESPGSPSRLIHLGPGTYDMQGLSLAQNVSLLGDGEGRTVVEGTVLGLRTGSSLSNLTVTKGTRGGIVVSAGESPQITSCTITENRGSFGLECQESASPTLTNCTVSKNEYIGVNCQGSSATLTNCTISENKYDGVHCRGGSPTLANCTISENANCGLYCAESSPVLVNCVVSKNRSGVGCGSGSSPTLTNCMISGNSGRGVGCGSGSSPTLTRCTISRNRTAGDDGAGVYCSGSAPRLLDCVIVENFSVSEYEIEYDDDGDWHIVYFGGRGGGVYCVGSSSPTLTNCIITMNNADRGGGGVYCDSNSSPTLTNCTISGNRGWKGGGGVFCYWDSSPTLTNCIVWGNSPEAVCGDLSRCLTDLDPLFVDPTAGDFRVQSGSPAIDAGTSAGAPTTDIEGNSRPCWNGTDIGAYEYCGEVPPLRLQQFVRGDSNTNGTFDISDAVATLGFLFLGTKAPSCLDAADSNDSGVVDLSDAVYSLQFLFIGGPAPEPPFPDCGIEPVIDGLDCQSYPGCQ